MLPFKKVYTEKKRKKDFTKRKKNVALYCFFSILNFKKAYKSVYTMNAAI